MALVLILTLLARLGRSHANAYRRLIAVPIFRPMPVPDHDPGPVTDLLLQLRSGDAAALDRLFPLVYEDLRRVAHRQLSGEREEHTLGTTGLVHEAYLRLVDQTRVEYRDRKHFFALASRAMRQVLVDYARRYRAQKRGGKWRPMTLDEEALPSSERAETVLALDDALSRLADLDARLSQVVECRFFGGLSEDETAEVVGVDPRTVRRDWVKAKKWLSRELSV
jgi:RNA polymerase sigma factor (TIGR02999 family)